MDGVDWKSCTNGRAVKTSRILTEIISWDNPSGNRIIVFPSRPCKGTNRTVCIRCGRKVERIEGVGGSSRVVGVRITISRPSIGGVIRLDRTRIALKSDGRRTGSGDVLHKVHRAALVPSQRNCGRSDIHRAIKSSGGDDHIRATGAHQGLKNFRRTRPCRNGRRGILRGLIGNGSHGVHFDATPGKNKLGTAVEAACLGGAIVGQTQKTTGHVKDLDVAIGGAVLAIVVDHTPTNLGEG